MKPKKLIEYMRRKGFKGQGLAEALGTTRATVSKMENNIINKLKIETLDKAAQNLNKTTSELLDELNNVRSTAQE
jgi:transcriptional regulator with XRE-family HTH domain